MSITFPVVLHSKTITNPVLESEIRTFAVAFDVAYSIEFNIDFSLKILVQTKYLPVATHYLIYWQKTGSSGRKLMIRLNCIKGV